MKIKTTSVISKFNCLQADCPDTCCKGWSMQLDDQTFEKYKGTELENAVSYDGQNKEIRVMKRDPETDYCVKFDNGICAIHRDAGAPMLGDACNFYPRVTRKFPEDIIMTGTLSCPEIVNLSLFDNEAGFTEIESDRVPNMLLSYEGNLAVNQAFLDACNADATAEQILARIYSASKSLSAVPQEEWATAAPFFLKIAEGMIPEPEYADDTQYNLLLTFAGVFHATRKKMNPRLVDVLSNIEKYLSVKIDWENLTLTPKEYIYQVPERDIDALLKKYIAAQLSFSTFPYAGIGTNILEKAKVLIFRFALIKLALLSALDDSKDGVIKTIQSISRVTDHVGDAALMLNLMDSFGWNTDASIIGLINY